MGCGIPDFIASLFMHHVPVFCCSAGQRGEIQIVKDGISGIPVFQLCSQAAAALDAGSQAICELDFLPDWDNEKVEQWMEKYGREL